MQKPINGKPIPAALRKLFGQAKDLSGLKPPDGKEPPPFEITIAASPEDGLVVMRFSVPIQLVGWQKGQALEIAADLKQYAESLPDEPTEQAAAPTDGTPPAPANDGKAQ
jgi:hypothetical protein